MNAPLVFNNTNEQTQLVAQPQSWQLLVLSARSEAALAQTTQNLADYLTQNTRFDLTDIAYTLQVGRRLFEHRRLVLCRDRKDAIRILREQPADRMLTTQQTLKNPEMIFLFGHDLNHDINANSQLCSTYACYRDTVEDCLGHLKSLLKRSTGEDLKQLPNPTLTFITQYATAQLWLSWGIQANEIISWGIGNITANCFKGTISLADALAQTLDAHHLAAKAELAQSDKSRVILCMSTLDESGAVLKQPNQNTVLLNSLTDNNGENDAVAFFLKRLGQLYFSGIRVDWAKIYGETQPRRVPLPTYPFERQRYWFATQSPQTESSSTPLKKDTPRQKLHYHRPELNTVYLEPRNPVEQVLVEISQTLLGFDRIGVEDNIADLGADSMFTMLLSKKIEENFRINISPHHLFMQPTLASLAEKIQQLIPTPLPEQAASIQLLTSQQMASYLHVLEMIERLPDEQVEKLLAQWSDQVV